MITLNNLPKISERKKKRLGQGHGSGKVKTGGRGTKGQKSRGKITRGSNTGMGALFKRLPLIRGKYRNKPNRHKFLIVNLKYLNIFADKTVVDLETLIKQKLVDPFEARQYGVKILGDGEISRALTVKLPCSKKGARKIEAAGGKVEMTESVKPSETKKKVRENE